MTPAPHGAASPQVPTIGARTDAPRSAGPLTIGRAARAVGVSRATLLYYDRIGLVSPTARSASGYRLYSDADVERLRRLRGLRDVGIGLEEVRQVLERREPAARFIEAHVAALGERIDALRAQQRLGLALLAAPGRARRRAGLLGKADWTAMFRRMGLTDDDMWRWHAEFERMQPEAHRDFLRSLGIGADEVAAIRRRSRIVKAPAATTIATTPPRARYRGHR
jgi:DNA-binding transcriptional MerR regulator